MSQSGGNSIAKGAMITVVMRGVDRLVGIISTLILARLLVPDDFGIVAMASVVVAFVDIIFDLGVSVALIQKKAPSQAFYNTAWTLRIMQSAAVALLLVAAGPMAAVYYHDPRVTAAIQVMAASLFLASLENIGVITFQKEMNFVADFRFTFAKRIVGFLATVVLTLLLHSYWGMLFGVLCARCCGIALSYSMHPMRPAFAVAHFREIFSVSQWVLVKNVSVYLDRNLHLILVGGQGRANITGGYTLANEVSDMPGTELLAPINRVLFPAFARIKDDRPALTRLLLLAQGIQVLITVPACVGFSMTATEVVPLMLGAKWLFIVPFVQILALSNILQSIITCSNYALTVLGKIRLIAITSWAQIIIFCIGAYLMQGSLSAELVAKLRMLSIILTFGLSYFVLLRHIPTLSVGLLVRSVYRPAIGCAAMALALHLVAGAFVMAPLPLLALKVACGVAVYTAVVLGLWLLAGRPDGAENYFIGKLQARRDSAVLAAKDQA
jgi:O-antigen/teichoic acid export membrane protein